MIHRESGMLIFIHSFSGPLLSASVTVLGAENTTVSKMFNVPNSRDLTFY